MYTERTTELHTKDTRTLPSSYPSDAHSLPGRRFSPATFPSRRCFREPGVSRRARITYDEFHHHPYARLDTSHVTRIYPSAFLFRSGQFSRVHQALMTEKTGANNRWMCVPERAEVKREPAIVSRPEYTAVLLPRRLAREATFRISSF